jgi:hypothetical protein
MKPFETFYGSFYEQPLLLWIVGLAQLGFVAMNRRASRSVRTFCLVFGVVSLIDTWLTAEDVAGVGSFGPVLGVAIATAFVVVGDFRVFLFLESARADGEIVIERRGVARAVGWSLIVPVATALLRRLLPDAPWRAQATFLLYEVALTCLMIGIRLAAPSAKPRWSRSVVDFVIAYYALWAFADALILGLHLDVGYLLRVVPNVLYYGGLLVVVSARAPAKAS